jgi:hypothetical protein
MQRIGQPRLTSRLAPAPADRHPFSRIPARSPSTRFRTSGSGLGSPIARGGVVEYDETGGDIVEPSIAFRTCAPSPRTVERRVV